MWVLRVKIPSKHFLLGQIAHKFDIEMYGYPLNSYKVGKYIHTLCVGFFSGKEKNKKAAFDFAKKDDRILQLEGNPNGLMMLVLKEPISRQILVDPRIIRITPTTINQSGFHTWNYACFERKPLQKVLTFALKLDGSQLLSFKQESIQHFMMMHMTSVLTAKQKQALDVAIHMGYYSYPKRCTIPQIAKSINVSYSTCQAHLKKAESKIMQSTRTLL